MDENIPKCLACKYLDSSSGVPECDILKMEKLKPWQKIEKLGKECLILTENKESYRKNIPNRIKVEIVTGNVIKSIENIGKDPDGDEIVMIRYYHRGKQLTIWKDEFDPATMIEIEEEKESEKKSKRDERGRFK